MKRFVIADTHFGHENIIKYCNRPFANAAEMDTYMIEVWNSIVGQDDVVWMLGDFALADKEKIRHLVRKLKGNKRLILGNHDRASENFYREAGFNFVSKWPVLIDDFVILSHAPLQYMSEECAFFNIFGHVHNDERYLDLSLAGACVSAERLNYRPVQLETIYSQLTKYAPNRGV